MAAHYRRGASVGTDHGGRSRLTMECLERRDCPAAVLGMSVSESVIFEGEGVDVTLTLSERRTTTERVDVTTKGISATYGVDYFAPLSQQVTFAPGQTTQKISIRALRDAPRDVVEGVEYFSILATPATASLRTRTATVGIVDYAPPPGITVTDVRGDEGNSGTSALTFTVSLTTSYAKPVTVAYATRDGSATTGDSDYVAASGVLTFAPGEAAKTVVVTVNGDRFLEANETFSLVLGSTKNGKVVKSAGIGTIINDEIDKPGFQVFVRFDDAGPGGAVPASVRNAALQAATRWSRVITGDVPSEQVGSIFIDDFEMVVQMGLLGGAPQGPGGVLANARPSAFRNGGAGLPYSGITGIDPNDVGYAPPFMIDVLAHEMGHAFGFTPFATVFSRWFAGDTFTGPNAVREFNAAFRRTGTSVPLQAGVLAHWDETVFGNELMSPAISGTPNPISRVTVGALADMGYTVNYAAAETYSPPLTGAPPPVIRAPSTTLSAPSPSRGPTRLSTALRAGSMGLSPQLAASNAIAAAVANERSPAVMPRSGVGATAKPGTTPGFARLGDAFRSLGRLS